MMNSEEDKKEHRIDEEIVRDEMEILALEEVLEEKREELHELKEERDEHRHHDHPQVIIVDTKRKEYPEKEISFRKVVLLAFPDAKFEPQFTYTVEYCKGPEQNPSGSMTDNGKDVYVKNEMVFDVERGDRS